MNPEEILKSYIEGRETGEDNKLRAAIGKLSADRSQELTNVLKALHQQIPMTVSELRSTISRNTDKMIESNERLSKSNEAYAKWMKWLTFGLLAIGLAQVVISFFK